MIFLLTVMIFSINFLLYEIFICLKLTFIKPHWFYSMFLNSWDKMKSRRALWKASEWLGFKSWTFKVLLKWVFRGDFNRNLFHEINFKEQTWLFLLVSKAILFISGKSSYSSEGIVRATMPSERENSKIIWEIFFWVALLILKKIIFI